MKRKQKISKQGFDRNDAIYDVVTELANASFNLTFGQLIRGDGYKAKVDVRHLLPRGARVL